MYTLQALVRPTCLMAPLLILALAPAIRAQGLGIGGPTPTELGADDWSAIQALHDARRHRIVEADGRFQAHNPGQRWSTQFDGRSFLVAPQVGDWSWGLGLVSYGFDGHMQNMGDKTPKANAEDSRLTYGWDSCLEEWYKNDRRGLEHGFTLAHRPEGISDGPLVLELVVRGELVAQVQRGGTSVEFRDACQENVLNYGGLYVFDANGTEQHAIFGGVGKRISIWIDETEAVYPLTIDPVAQQAYLKASNTESQDRFGRAVAIDGDRIVVGAPYEASSATAVNGDQSNNAAPEAGAAYVFVRSAGSWRQEAYLKATNANAYDRFGFSLAISGNRIVVGALGESSNAVGVDGDQGDNSALFSGAAYVFEFYNGEWTQSAYLKASNTDSLDYFAASIDVSGDTIVVGAQGEDGQATGVNGDGRSNKRRDSGAGYVFEYSGGAWAQTAYLKASNTERNAQFGKAVSVEDGRLAVGAPGEGSNATGVNGNQTNGLASDSGAAYVFQRERSGWHQQAYLKASNTGRFDNFGYSLAISGGLLLVGAPGEGSFSSGTDQSGAAYVFANRSLGWGQEAYLKASNTGARDRFGHAVDLAGNRAIVGAYREASFARGVDGDQEDDSAIKSGAAYLFQRTGYRWSQFSYLKASNGEARDEFGRAVAISGDRAVVGAAEERSGATGVGGDFMDNSSPAAGAAYVFDLIAHGTNYCPGRMNSTFTSAQIESSGPRAISANQFRLHSWDLPPNTMGYFWSAPNPALVSNPAGSQGTLCLGGGIGYHLDSLRNSGPFGHIDYSLDLTQFPTPAGPIVVQSGETWFFQCWYQDRNPGPTSNFSGALSVLFE